MSSKLQSPLSCDNTVTSNKGIKFLFIWIISLNVVTGGVTSKNLNLSLLCESAEVSSLNQVSNKNKYHEMLFVL